MDNIKELLASLGLGDLIGGTTGTSPAAVAIPYISYIISMVVHLVEIIASSFSIDLRHPNVDTDAEN